MTHPVISPKKLIEVALPLDAINAASAREKSIRHGHPSTLHLWWARRPLAAARAVIFSQLVHDPEDLWRCQNSGKEPNQQVRGHWTKARARLFRIIEDLVKWENSTNEVVLEEAREEIRRSWEETCELNKHHPQAVELFDPERMPGLHDPFAGGGTIPLEAQRLGLKVVASDLNPVAVLINKAMIEIPPKFACLPPVNPESQKHGSVFAKEWRGAEGLAADVRYFGQWIRSVAEAKLGHLYPPIDVTSQVVREQPHLEPLLGSKLNSVAWIWARTVPSPNPAFSGIAVPLVSTFMLSTKKGKEVYVRPILEESGYRFEVVLGAPPRDAKSGTKAARGANFRCVMSGALIDPSYIKQQALAGRMRTRLMAIVADGHRGRVYLSPTKDQESVASDAASSAVDELLKVPIANDPRPMTVLLYGLTRFDQLFTPRQLLALTTFSDLIASVRDRIVQCAIATRGGDRSPEVEAFGNAYADAVCTYLAFAVSKLADRGSSLCTWFTERDSTRNTFSRQALQISWDFAELNVLLDGTGSFSGAAKWTAESIEGLAPVGSRTGSAIQADAQSQSISAGMIVSTDPPYYDNIGYADLSDYFYLWLRRTLKAVYPDLFSTVATPKAEELVAATYRHASKRKAEEYFLDGMTRTMTNVASLAHPSFPTTIYYAFKQSDTEEGGTNSTGWATFLEAVCRSGLSIQGTWPMRTELGNRMRGTGSNALASSVVLVCRRRSSSAGSTSRRQFIRELNTVLPVALDAMTRGGEGVPSPVAPVDLSQAIIGPGMAVYSRYSSVLEADGSPMTVRTALQLINRFLAEDDFDSETQFCLHWFDQHGWDDGAFGGADVLARSKATSVAGLAEAGVVHSRGGKVRLLRWTEYPRHWNPLTDTRAPVWEALHHLIRSLRQNGESAAAKVLAGVKSQAEPARQLAYRLYTLCERKGWAEDARAYNELVTSWPAIESAVSTSVQTELFD